MKSTFQSTENFHNFFIEQFFKFTNFYCTIFLILEHFFKKVMSCVCFALILLNIG